MFIFQGLGGLLGLTLVPASPLQRASGRLRRTCVRQLTAANGGAGGKSAGGQVYPTDPGRANFQGTSVTKIKQTTHVEVSRKSCRRASKACLGVRGGPAKTASQEGGSQWRPRMEPEAMTGGLVLERAWSSLRDPRALLGLFSRFVSHLSRS